MRNDGRDYETWLSWLKVNSHKDSCPEVSVPQTLFFFVNAENEILGAASIRHFLDETNIREGGHTGYGIRPSCRFFLFTQKSNKPGCALYDSQGGVPAHEDDVSYFFEI